jgi:hemolysin activation/secretion protein
MMRPRCCLLACALGVLMVHSAQASAQSLPPPDAGQSMRGLEQRPPALPPKQSLELDLPDAPLEQVQDGGATVQVDGFVLEGNAAIADAELLPLLADLAHRRVSLGQLQAGAHRLTLRYRERGYPLARAFLPAQDIEDGKVRIVVLEGRYGQIGVHNASRLRDAAVAAPLRALKPGQAVRAAPLERALLSLRELAGVQASATLQPGASVGATDLVVDVQPGPPLSGSIEADNQGNRYTGQYRLGGSLALDSPLRLGDRFSLQVLGTDEDQYYYRAAWQVPVGPWSTRLGASWSRMDYRLGRDFADLDAHGKALIASAFVSQPLLRRRDANLYAVLQFDRKRLQDDIDLYDSRSRKHSRVLTATLYGDSRDGWLGGGANSFALSWSHGRLAIDDADGRALDTATAGSAGDFNVVRPSLVRLQGLGGRFGLYAQAQGQWSDANLDSSEKFYLGGADGVRAYPQGEAAGDQGWLASLELRYTLTAAWQLSLFVDHGQVRLDKRPWSEDRNHRGLSALGTGANWAAGGWRIGATVAWRLGDAHAESGGGRSPQLWVQALRGF